MTETIPDTEAGSGPFDLHDPTLAVDPFARYRAMQAQCPVHWSDAHNGYWVLVGYDAVHQAARDDGTFLSGPGVTIPRAPTRAVLPLESDAPLTQKYRAILQHRFTPAAVATHGPAIRERADRLVDGFIERGECDVMTELATPLTAQTILGLIGMSEEKAMDIAEMVHAIVHDMPSDPEKGFNSAIAIYGETSAAIAERQANGFRDDALSDLMQATIDGEPLSDDIIFDYVLLLILGGMDTSAAVLGHAMVRLYDQPELREQLLADPALIDNAVEEFLRIDSPVQGLGRTLAHDHEFAGCQMKAGDRALLLWAAANRDPAAFPDPDTLDLTRHSNRHLSFGVGLHRCLGSNLGRLMFKILLETVLDRLGPFEIVGDPVGQRFADLSAVFAYRHLPVRFTPGARR